MRKRMLLFMTGLWLTGFTYAQAPVSVCNTIEEAWQGVNYVHKKIDYFRHIRYLDPQTDNGNQFETNFLLADIMTSGFIPGDSVVTDALSIARTYILGVKRKMRTITARLNELSKPKKFSSLASLNATDSAELVKILEFEKSLYSKYDSAYRLFTKRNTVIFKNRYADEIQYFLSLRTEQYPRYAIIYNRNIKSEVQVKWMCRRFLRITNTTLLENTSWKGQPCSIIQATPDNKKDESDFGKLSVDIKESKKQAADLFTKFAFVLKNNTWHRTDKTPAFITCLAAEYITTEKNVFARFIYKK